MDRLTLLETFAAALDEGSLNRAARSRGISQSAVSQQIAQLEALLGQQLLHRTARGVRATRPGELVFAHAQTLLAGYDRMTAELSALDGSVTGTFRVSVSAFLGRHVLGPMLLDLDQRYPDLNIVMRVEDRLVDVVRENIDLAIRSGHLGDTDGTGRKITALETVLFAAPAYLDKAGRPQHPDELKRLKFIQHHEDQTRGFFPLHRDGQEYQAPVRVGFTADDPDLITRAAETGAGIARAPRMMVAEGLASGRYEEVLPGYHPPDKDIFAVYPSRHASDARREMVIDGFLKRLEEIRHASLARQHGIAAITA